MPEVNKEVCVLGAGASGLSAVKSCLEAGLGVACFEKTADIGGLWRFKPLPTKDEASVMATTVINTSKELMAFSDFPPPPAAPNYMHNRDVLAYFQAYADHFDLLRHIRFRHTIRSVRRSEDYDVTGRWRVEVVDETGHVSENMFDGVMICSGHHVDPYIPDIPGIDNFKGRVLHSQEYKESSAFAGQKVAVVGIGNSAVDIAVDLSRSTEKVHLCTRRGAWLQWKVGPGGLPVDVAKTRWRTALKRLFPAHYAAKAEAAVNEREKGRDPEDAGQLRFDLSLYGLRPSCGIGEAHPTESDELPIRILSGAIDLRHNIQGVNKEGNLELSDGGTVVEADAIIFCTGYTYSFPFLEDGNLIPVNENQVDLYKYMFPPALRQGTLAIIGLIQPLGSTVPVAELQSRLAVQVMSGHVDLPSELAMRADIEAKKVAMTARYVHSRRHTLQVDFIGYMDEMADLFGARPGWVGFLFSDPRLCRALLFWPCAPYQFRLRGPHAWPGARTAILSVWDRILQPTKTRPQQHSKDKNNYGMVLLWGFLGSAVLIGVVLNRSKRV